MKVVFVIGSGKLGGAERQAFLTARYLKEQKNWHVSMIVLTDPDGPLKKMCASAEIDYHFFHFTRFARTLYLYQLLIKIIPFFRTLKPDVIISYTDSPNILCGRIWKWTGARLHIWSQRHCSTFPPSHSLMEKALRNTQIVVSNSQAGIEHLKSEYPRFTSHIHFYYVPNGTQMDKPQYNPQQWRQRIGITEDTFVALMIANLSYEYGKDHTTLLKAWKIFLGQLDNTSPLPMLLLAGRFESKTNDLIQLSMELNIFARVRFLGAVSDISGLASAADLLVHSATMEGMPNAVLEGMACGLPVVATDIPGIREIVGDDQKNYLVAPGDDKTMAEKIMGFYKDGLLRKSLGNANKKRIEQHFSIEKMGEEHYKIMTKHL